MFLHRPEVRAGAFLLMLKCKRNAENIAGKELIAGGDADFALLHECRTCPPPSGWGLGGDQ